jgi:hypothetical protein
MRKIVTAAFGLTLAGVAAAAAAEVAWPEGWRAWKHVKSMVIEQGHPLYESFGGIHHIYANAEALDGYRMGKFPDGAVIIFDLLEAIRQDNAVVEGARKVVGVMQKDSKAFAATGGWGFEGFAGGDPTKRVVGAKAAEACFGCHAGQAASDYVFSRLRD